MKNLHLRPAVVLISIALGALALYVVVAVLILR